MRPPAVRSIATVVGLVVLAACGGGSESSTNDTSSSSSGATSTVASTTEAPATTAAPATTPPTTTPPTTAAPATTVVPITAAPTTVPTTSAPDADRTTITLDDAGEEPRAELRYRIEPGSSAMVIEQTQEITQSIDGESGPATPAFTIRMELANVVEATAGGWLVDQTVTAAGAGDDAPAQLASQLNDALQPLIGLSTATELDDRGFVLSSSITSSLTDIPAEIAGTLESFADAQASVPLPEEAVGPGARWTVAQQMTVNGIDLVQTVRFELVAIDGDRIHLVGEGSQFVPTGPIDLPGVPASTETSVVAWDGMITADAWIDLTNPTPDSTVTADVTQLLSITDGADTVELDQRLVSTVVVGPG